MQGVFLCVGKLHPTGRKYRPVDYSGAAVFLFGENCLAKKQNKFFCA